MLPDPCPADSLMILALKNFGQVACGMADKKPSTRYICARHPAQQSKEQTEKQSSEGAINTNGAQP